METIIDPTFPLIDLHRHLDGSVRVSTILELSRQHNLPLPADDIDGLREHVLVTSPKPDIAAFFTKFQYQTGILVNASACRRIAYEAVEDAKHEGIDYIELRFSPWFMAEPHQLHPEAVVEAVVEGVRAGERDFGIKANLIGILSRSYGPEVCFKELAALRSQEAAITALDLAGLELEFPGDLFVEHFAQVRDTRWHIFVNWMRIANSEIEFVTRSRCLVTHTDQGQFFLKSFGDTNNHVIDQLTHGTCHGICFT